MDIDVRYKKFLEGYEQLCSKYQMEFRVIDLWEAGYKAMEVYDKEDGLFVID